MNKPEKIKKNLNGSLIVPACPVIPYIEGDGIGPDIWSAAEAVISRGVEAAYHHERKISWIEVYAGEKGYAKTGQWLPDATIEALAGHRVAIKGPLTTPVGEGIRSLNVQIRQELDLYACIRPVKHIEFVPSPMKNPENVDMVVFRENTEDLYKGIEWEAGSVEAKKLLTFLRDQMGADVSEQSGIGIKPISEKNTKRLVKMAIAYAVDHQLESVTLMHKGNIMKYTEGAFSKWGYEAAEETFRDQVITEQELYEKFSGKRPRDRVVIKDRIADMLFQQILLRPDEFQVIATPNLNGDYISDALAAQAGGIGMAPGANIGATCAVFEATHGTAPKYAGLDKVNPGSLILSGAMMLDHMGWKEAASLVRNALCKTIGQKSVTYDLARQMEGAREVKCSEFGELVAKNI